MRNDQTLSAITNRLSGIVIYDEKYIISCDWSTSCRSGGLPLLGPFGNGTVAFYTDSILVLESEKTDVNLNDYINLEKQEIIFEDSEHKVLDTFSDDKSVVGNVYKISYNHGKETVMVLCPKGWE